VVLLDRHRPGLGGADAPGALLVSRAHVCGRCDDPDQDRFHDRRPPSLRRDQRPRRDPATSADALDQQLGEWAKQVDGPIVQDLAEIKRIRIFQGWFRRSVVLTKKESGYDLKPMSLRPTKEELPAFVELLKDRPGTELK
jgi:hypothetical protein